MAMPTTRVKETSDVLLQDAPKNYPKESIDQSQCPPNQEARRASSMITRYLLENVAEFRKLAELRQKVDRSGAESQAEFQSDDAD
jgi:hypothetical protein